MKRFLFNLAFCGASCGFVVPAIAADSAPSPAVAVQDVRLQDQGLLVGRAVTTQGAARENVKVALSFQGKMVAEATTNENGVFAVKGLRGGVHVVQTEGKQEVVRLWTADAAPEAAAEGLVLSEGQVVRGQQQNPGGVGSFLADNLVGVGIVGATAGTAIAVSASGGDSSN
ncbi:MAG TPA: hypothetical protein VGN57_13580 [Pirellulaceae bacterium]|jgi:hypothetical protein|nr:hypothetical protein [Pirellulaceae bacterium]